MQKEQFLSVWKKYLNGEASEGELRDMLAFMRTGEADEWLEEQGATPMEIPEVSLVSSDWERIWADINRQTLEEQKAPVRRFRGVVRWAAAAAFVGILATGALVWMNSGKEDQSMAIQTVSDLPPGKEGAVLTLADGSTVVLDSIGNGVVGSQQGVEAVLRDGQLAYQGSAKSNEVIYNKVSTPRGRQFRLTLPDGSRVWLNAASSLRYPVAFTGTKREVEVEGEAYFEIMKDVARPFLVRGGGKNIRVLGTSFNVNVYGDEPVYRTTLLSGSIRVEAEGKAVVLLPGQQAVTEKGALTVQAGSDAAVAWKDNVFNFHHQKLPSVMRQIARWYDVEIVYEGEIPDVEFWGKIGRDMNLSQIMTFLEKSDVHCRLEKGNKLVIGTGK